MSAPILSLPNELFVAIVAAGQEGRVADLDASFDFRTEWTLSHLSRRFRDVVVGAPLLWTFIDVDLRADGSMAIFKLYLERSAAYTISLNLRYLSDDADDDSEQCMTAMERLRWVALHIHRIWWLRIELRTEWPEKVLSPLRDIAAPNLHHLEIVHNDYQPFLQGFRVEIFSFGAPRLAFVKMAGCIPLGGFMPFTFPPWTASVTHLKLRGGEDYAFRVAVQCPLLVHLHLEIDYWDTPERRYHMPSLESLHITISDGEDQLHLEVMINLVDTPALTELIINNTHGDQIFMLLNSTSVSSSFPALTSLSFIRRDSCLCDLESPLSNIISSPPLQLFPALSSLTLINQCFTHNLIDDILGSASHSWPHLTTLTLSSKENTLKHVCKTLLDAVRSKRQRGLPRPKLSVSPALFSLMADCDARTVKEERMEIFDPADVLEAIRTFPSIWES